MYFTRLPDHTEPGFDEALHFGRFKKHNIIFNAESSSSHCDDHAGCLSIKTILRGEEWYGIDGRQLAVRPGQFLVLNDEQRYSCRIGNGEKTRSLSVFFKKEFASAVLHDLLNNEEHSLDDPFTTNNTPPEFFQTLNDITPGLQSQLSGLVTALEHNGNNETVTDEHLIFLLRSLLRQHGSDMKHAAGISAVKAGTRYEIYKRLCIARDVLHSAYTENLDLNSISRQAGLSVPQLVRQFRSAFHITPHQYLVRIRLGHAAHLLQHSGKPVQDIGWLCGFENTSAFGRAFKSAYGVQPGVFRNGKK